MANDSRKKGCPNPECSMNHKKTMHKVEMNYCPMCATPLILVCKKCFRQIEDLGPKHRLCSLCEAEKEEKKEMIKHDIQKAANKAVHVVAEISTPVAVGVAAKAVAKGQKIAVDAGSKIVEEGAAKVGEIIAEKGEKLIKK